MQASVLVASIFIDLEPATDRWLHLGGVALNLVIFALALLDIAVSPSLRNVEIEREMTLPGRDAYDAARPARPVTVLYSPRNPRRAVIYEFSGYVVRDAEVELRR